MAGTTSNKNRKYGRSRGSPQNIAYKTQNRKRTNKIRKLKRMLKAQPNNSKIADRLKSIERDYKYGERK